MEKSVAFHTLGCKVNRYETDAVAQSFLDAGYQVRPFDSPADVYVINTCTVTGEADRKSRQFLRQAKKRNPDALVVAMGCHVELSDASAYADILIGNKDKMKVIDLVEQRLGAMRPASPSTSAPDHSRSPERGYGRSLKPDGLHSIRTDAQFEEMGSVVSREETRAYIKIEDGCNSFCSYCAIPLARGRVRSREESAIIKEVEELVRHGFHEIVLTGIHVCSYGADRDLESDALIDLTAKLSKISGLERIRLGSLEPQSLTETFIRKASGISVLCPHFHISLQSGSDTVLCRMNRRYTCAEYAHTIQNIRRQIPAAMFTTDVITGFPGETEEEHRETIAFCKGIDFLDMHVFKFSERKGTKAAAMSAKVDAKTAARRSAELIALAQEMKEGHFSRAVGSHFRVLVERIEESQATGYTENYLPARILLPTSGQYDIHAANKIKSGAIVSVETIHYDKDSVYARILRDGSVPETADG